jgi:hypothetical protein
MQSDRIWPGEKPALTLKIGTSRTACHAEGRGFESDQPLWINPATRGVFVPEPFFGATDDQAAREVTVASTFLTT